MTSFRKEDEDPQFDEDEDDDDSGGAGGRRRELKLENDVEFKKELTEERCLLSGGMGLFWTSG